MSDIKIIKAGYDRLHSELIPYMLRTEEETLRSRVIETINPIIWNAWHMLRAEDMYFNTVMFNQEQVFHQGDWKSLLNNATSHIGTGMTQAEADQLSQKINLDQLRNYNIEVGKRTITLSDQVLQMSSDTLVDKEEMDRRLLEADAFPEGMRQNRAEAYAERSASESLLGLLSHSHMHFGQFMAIKKPL